MTMMKPTTSRRLLLGGLALALLGALAFVALRTGPLAPVKVQVTTVQKGRVALMIALGAWMLAFLLIMLLNGTPLVN